jgi:hypothetical protein
MQSASNSEIWYLAAPPTGSREIWIDQSAAGVMGAEAVTLIGVHQANPIADSDGGVVTTGTVVASAAALVPDGTCRLEAVVCDGSGATTTYSWNGSISNGATLDIGTYNCVTGFQASVTGNVTPSCTRGTAGNLDQTLSAILLRAA